MMLSVAACSSGQTAENENTAGELQDFDIVLDWYPNAVHSFIYVAMEKGYYDNEIEKLGGKVYSIPYRKKSIIQYIKNIRSIFRNYPIVHIHTASTKVIFDVIIAKLVGVKKIIVHSHSISDQDSKLIHLLCKCFLKFTPIMRFACSKEAGEWLFGKKKEVYIVKNGIDTSQYAKKLANKTTLVFFKPLKIPDKATCSPSKT